MAVPSQELVNQAINKVLLEWAAEFIRLRETQARQKIKVASGSGHQSFSHSTIKANGAQLAEALFMFNTYLRIADMKKGWTKAPPINVIEDWIEKKGVDKFKRKYQAKHRYTPKDPKQLINKIAWGISLSIKKRGSLKKKRVKWYSKNYNRGIGALYTELLDALSKESLDHLKKELRNVST